MNADIFIAVGGGELVFFDSSNQWQLLTLSCIESTPPSVRSLGYGSHLRYFSGCAAQPHAMSGILENHDGRYSVLYPRSTGQIWRKMLPDGEDARVENVAYGAHGWHSNACSIATDNENVFIHHIEGGQSDALVTCQAQFRP